MTSEEENKGYINAWLRKYRHVIILATKVATLYFASVCTLYGAVM